MMVNNIDLEPKKKWFGHKEAEFLRETLYKKIVDLHKRGTHYGTETPKAVWTPEMWSELSVNLDPD